MRASERAVEGMRSELWKQVDTPLLEERRSHSQICAWYALSVRSRHEKRAATMLAQKGYPTVLPLYKCKRPRPGRWREVQLPLFPGYVFCLFNPQERLPILVTPGVLHVIGVGRRPVPVEESEIEALRRFVLSSLHALPWPYLQEGQSVYIADGPLQGITGVLITVKNTHRLVLSVTILQRSMAVEIERKWVVPSVLQPPPKDYSMSIFSETLRRDETSARSCS